MAMRSGTKRCGSNGLLQTSWLGGEIAFSEPTARSTAARSGGLCSRTQRSGTPSKNWCSRILGNGAARRSREGKTNPAAKFVVLDAAVMLEAGWNNEVDRIVYVDAPRELRLSRLATRSGWTDTDLTAREAAQWPDDVKKARADAVIVNDRRPGRVAGTSRSPVARMGNVPQTVMLRRSVADQLVVGSSSRQSVVGVQGAQPRFPPMADPLPDDGPYARR